MCRMEGDRTYLCDNARGGRPCRDVRRVPTSYIHQRGSASRDDTPSPVNPSTPTSSGTYLTQRRRPSNSGSRPSTRDGQRINPEIIIEFGSKKGKSSKYPSLSISAKTHKRHSSGSFGSNDAAVDSGESEASYTLRTGYPEAPLPPAFDQPTAFLTPLPTHGHHPRNTPSASSSRTPSLLVPSETDFDPSATRRSTRPSATIIHHATPDPASPTRPQHGTSSGSYKTKRIVPRDLPQVPQTPTGSHPLDYDQYADHSGSSRASSGIAESSRPANSGQRRKKSSETNVYQDVSQRLAEDVAKADNDKHVRFELGRYEAREKERAERALAEKEKERAAIREAERERKRLVLEQEKKEREERERKRLERLEQEERERKRLERQEQERKEREREREREEQRAKDRKKERSKPPTTDTTKRPSSSRRMSSLMTPQELAEQQRLLEADTLFMQSEKQAAEAREREERRAAARQQQESSSYYDPRGGDRSMSSANNATKPRRDSAASITRPSGLVNTSTRRRPSITQPNPPTASALSPTDYSTRPQTRTRAPPPLSFPKNFNQDYGRPPSARRPSLTPDNPFLSASVASPTADPWDLRNMDQALPSARTSDGRKPVHRTPQYVSTFDDDDASFDDFQPSFASRTGLGRSGSKKKH